MGQAHGEIERMLVVGTVLVFQTEPNNRFAHRVPTVFRGWRTGHHLLIDRPKLPNGMHMALQEAQQCVVRFVHDGVACAFDTQILDWDTRQHAPYARVRWPSRIEQVKFRRFERVSVNEPCRVAYPLSDSNWELTEGQLRDVSIGGCAILAKGAIDDNTPLRLTFTLPDGVQVKELRAVVRNVRMAGNRYLIGCSFDDGTPDEREKVVFFITSALQLRRLQEHEAAVHVLLIDTDAGRCREVRELLDREGYVVAAAQTVVDGLYLLRMTPPEVVLLGNGIPCYNCVGMLLGRDGFGDVTTIFYGGSTDDYQRAAHALPLRQHVPVGPEMKQQLLRSLKIATEARVQPAAPK